eukprot:TRINITY_DN80491_c0_g1_i1.p1 TRINITY_DN80491_c0_g1~~TRINITY_DN80491_c0_g1_i1.p1  ORF type:complete len:299 (-),score=69.22 TRINITY_DN80491_c0_g1_i1:56-952(-)
MVSGSADYCDGSRSEVGGLQMDHRLRRWRLAASETAAAAATARIRRRVPVVISAAFAFLALVASGERTSLSAFAHGAVSNLRSGLSLRQPGGLRDRSDVACGVLKRNTKKIKIAQKIAQVRARGPVPFSNKKMQKQVQLVNKIAQDDAYTEEFFSFDKETAVGGDYVMPVDSAAAILKGIYGAGPTLQTLSIHVDDSEIPKGLTPDDLDGLEKMRRKVDPGQGPGLQAQEVSLRQENMRVSMLPGVSRYVGSMPSSIYANHDIMGVKGGAQSDSMQDVWIGGNSVAYDMEGEEDPFAQ